MSGLHARQFIDLGRVARRAAFSRLQPRSMPTAAGNTVPSPWRAFSWSMACMSCLEHDAGASKRVGGASSCWRRSASSTSAAVVALALPLPAAAPILEVPRREPRRYRSGRDVQLNIEAWAEVIETFYAIADRHGWVLGQAFEEAVAALERSLAGKKK